MNSVNDQQIVDQGTMDRMDDPAYFINRHLSWLSFNERVLQEAENPSNPLMERLKFLSIVSSNLDEFFMVRVASLKDQVRAGLNKADSKTGMTTKEQIYCITISAHEMVQNKYKELNESLLPALQAEGIKWIKAQQMNEEQHRYAHGYFHDRVFPVLTPMAVDVSRPFPMLMNRTLNIAVTIDKRVNDILHNLIAVVQVPALLPRYIPLPCEEGKYAYILLEELISCFMSSLFVGHCITSVYPFRITRNADLPLNEEGVEDLLEEIEKELIKREMGSTVRVEIDKNMSQMVREFLKESLELEDEDIYSVDGPLDLTFLMHFTNQEPFAHLRFEPLYPQPARDVLEEPDIFRAISKKDILLHNPYESFDPVVQFIQSAAEDPSVLAIKQTLYRVSGDSSIVAALADAAENGKQVMVLVELKARFDEENNIVWAKRLEESGCHVIYGFVGLKTHSKIAMVVRQEGDSLKRYVHLGTGNYNDTTARFYTDLSMFTCRKEVGDDASLFFNYLSGYSETPSLQELIIAPSMLREKYLSLIENEILKSTTENPGRIIVKMNSITDKGIIMALYRASQAGVKIDLIVRGICCLRPGIPGVSENIRVISIIGHFLEHSRIYYFANGGDEQLFMSSADWMTRNLDRRIEILFPIRDPDLVERTKEILNIQLRDNVKARELLPDGTYRMVHREGLPIDSQMFFQQLASQNFLDHERKYRVFQLK